MMIGTSGRTAFALGRSSSPLIPGMLMSDRMRMSDRSPALGDAFSAIRRRLRKFHRKAAGAEVAPELLAEQELHVGFVVDHENKKVHARSSRFGDRRSHARQNDSEFGELAGLAYRPRWIRHVA